jgi:hypothetical protein
LLLSGSRLAARYGEPGNAAAVPLNVAIKALPVVVSASRGQGIQTRALFRDDGAGGVCRVRVTAFYTHRAAHGRTAEERSAYAIGLKAGEQAPADAILPTDAELNMMAQKNFKQQGPATSRVGISRSKTVTRTGSRRHTAAEPNAEGRFAFGSLHRLHWAPHFRHCASITKHFE